MNLSQPKGPMFMVQSWINQRGKQSLLAVLSCWGTRPRSIYIFYIYSSSPGLLHILGFLDELSSDPQKTRQQGMNLIGQNLQKSAFLFQLQRLCVAPTVCWTPVSQRRRPAGLTGDAVCLSVSQPDSPPGCSDGTLIHRPPAESTSTPPPSPELFSGR